MPSTSDLVREQKARRAEAKAERAARAERERAAASREAALEAARIGSPPGVHPSPGRGE